MTDWRANEARTQTVFREMNEWTEEASDGAPDPTGSADSYLCECSDATCSAPIQLARAEYEHIREDGRRFAIALHHENPEVDVLVAENDRYATVEKIFGIAARIARATDPRR